MERLHGEAEHKLEWLQQLFVKSKRWTTVSMVYDIDDLLDNCDQTLFDHRHTVNTVYVICFQANKNKQML